jgi:hypothetical protein
MYSEIKIKQSRFNFLKKIFKKCKSETIFELDVDTFHCVEHGQDGREFIWSKPKSSILLSNVNTLTFSVDSGMDRNLTVECGIAKHVYNLKNRVTYRFSIDTYRLSHVKFYIPEYLPETDSRSLGLRFYNFEIS